jgi:hypothetical protein
MEEAPATAFLKETLPVQKKRILVMLGARMVNPDGPKGWDFPLYSLDQQNSGTSLSGEVSGGASRMRALETLYKNQKGKETIILVTGGKDQLTGASKAKEASRQLSERYGLPAESVVAVSGAGSTLGNAGATMEYIHAHKTELGEVREIGIVTNDYHMLRAWIMFSQAMLKLTAEKDLQISPDDMAAIREVLEDGSPEKHTWNVGTVQKTRQEVMRILVPYFAESKVQVVPVVVEDVLEEGGISREKYAELLRTNEWVKKTISFEQKGVLDLLEGKYKGT